MIEGCPRQDHGELTRVVGVVIPGLALSVPGVISPWKPHDPVSLFSPYPKQSNTDTVQATLPFFHLFF